MIEKLVAIDANTVIVLGREAFVVPKISMLNEPILTLLAMSYVPRVADALQDELLADPDDEDDGTSPVRSYIPAKISGKT